MPKFADLLKEAKTGRVQALHEFLTNFDPSTDRLHCFYEGREDEIFYRNFLSRLTSARRLVPYICGNKDAVYGVLSSVSHHNGCQQSLFFVDKDLADVMQESRPVHDRLFVTEFYSVENYIVSHEVLARFCRDFISCRGIVLDHDKACEAFNVALEDFYELILPVMAWIVAVRRRGQKPNLRNIKLKEMFRFDDDLQFEREMKRGRINYLCSVTGVSHSPGIYKDMRRAIDALYQYQPKRVVRGHFESWFFVEYFKAMFMRLKAEVEKNGGGVSLAPTVEHSSFVPLAAPTIETPVELSDFLAGKL